ncbi:MAG: hypothetical protein JNM84_15900 [Planctomycetes bacterium]|nr:hypothetical protein [Planctomycetota bacterium]
MSDPADAIEPEEAGSGEARADELLVHGLLRSQALDDAVAVKRRVDAVMVALEAPAPRRERVLRRWPWLWLGAAAACALAYLLLRSAPEASRGSANDGAPMDSVALVEDAREKTRQLGDRTYSIAAWIAGEDTPVLRGELDLRGEASYLLRAELHGLPLTTGVEGDAPWFSGHAQMIERLREDPRASLMFAREGEPRFELTPDALLAPLARDYQLAAPARTALAEHPGVMYLHVVAQRTAQDDRPDRIEAWIEESSGLLRHLALRWFPGPEHEPEPFDLRDPPRTELVVLFALEERASFPPDWFRAERHPR